MTELRARTSADWPDAAETPTAPLLVLLHGFGSNEHDLASLAPALPQARPWASLRAPLTMGYDAAAWFPLDPTFALDQEAVDEATRAVWSWIDAHASHDAAIVPIGFSQGGFMALQLLRTRPARVPGAVVLSGFANTQEQPADSDLARDRPPVLWARGDADPVVPAHAITHLDDWLEGHADARRVVRPALGHGIDETVMTAVRSFIDAL